jgi:hypothetical protein
MGIRDAETQLCSSQAFSADAVSENAYDLGVDGRDIAEGEPMGIGISVEVAAAVDDADETYEFQAIQSAAAALSAPDILALIQPGRAALVVGSRWILPLPPGVITKRYLGLNFNGGGTTPTVTVSAFIAPLSFLGGWKAYAKGFTVQS